MSLYSRSRGLAQYTEAARGRRTGSRKRKTAGTQVPNSSPGPMAPRTMMGRPSPRQAGASKPLAGANRMKQHPGVAPAPASGKTMLASGKNVPNTGFMRALMQARSPAATPGYPFPTALSPKPAPGTGSGKTAAAPPVAPVQPASGKTARNPRPDIGAMPALGSGKNVPDSTFMRALMGRPYK